MEVGLGPGYGAMVVRAMVAEFGRALVEEAEELGRAWRNLRLSWFIVAAALAFVVVVLLVFA